MGELIEKYVAIGIQYRNSQQEISQAATKRNLRRMGDYVKWAHEQFSYGFPVKLIAFPELATSSVAGLVVKSSNMGDVVKAAEEIPGPIIEEIGSWAKKYDCFIAFGMLSKLPQYPKAAFNTAVIIDDKGGVCLTYRKTNPWLPDEFFSSVHDLKDTWDFEKNPLFPVAKTRIGNLGAYICNDGMTPEPCRQLAFNGAEVMYHPELLMDPWVVPPQEYFELQTRWNSVVNMSYHVSVNTAWEPHMVPPYGCQGGSMITDYEGRLLSCCPKAAVEAYCMAIIDIKALRDYRTSMPTHNGLNSFKGDLYDYYKRPVMYPSHPQAADDLNWDVNKSREAVDKAMKRFWSDYYKDAVK